MPSIGITFVWLLNSFTQAEAPRLFSQKCNQLHPLVTYRSIKQEPHALTIPEIKTVIDNYASATLRAKKAGFDAVELHGGMGYLINQFLSKATTKRNDDYGGSLENRVRFARKIILAIKETAGKDYPIIFRMSGGDFVEEGLKID